MGTAAATPISWLRSIWRHVRMWTYQRFGISTATNLRLTAHELMAWFGWLTIREAERYTRNAERRQLAIGMAKRLGT